MIRSLKIRKRFIREFGEHNPQHLKGILIGLDETTGFIPEASKKPMVSMGIIHPDSKMARELSRNDEFHFTNEFHISLKRIRKALRTLGRTKKGYEFGMYSLKGRWIFYLSLNGDCVLIVPKVGNMDVNETTYPSLFKYFKGIDMDKVTVWKTLRKIESNGKEE